MRAARRQLLRARPAWSAAVKEVVEEMATSLWAAVPTAMAAMAGRVTVAERTSCTQANECPCGTVAAGWQELEQSLCANTE